MARYRSVFAAATDAASGFLDVTSNNPVTLVGYGFDPADTVAVQICYDGTAGNVVDCYKSGVAVTLTPTNNPVTVYGPGKFKINKGATTGTVGVYSIHEP